jgi:YHS domain-containing protein
MPSAESSEAAQERLRYCANCGRQLTITGLEYWEYAGRIQLFCSQRCYDRFKADPTRRLIASPLGES